MITEKPYVGMCSIKYVCMLRVPTLEIGIVLEFPFKLSPNFHVFLTKRLGLKVKLSRYHCVGKCCSLPKTFQKPTKCRNDAPSQSGASNFAAWPIESDYSGPRFLS